MMPDRFRYIAQVGGEPEFKALRAEAVAYRIGGVMRYCEAADFNIPDCEARASLKLLNLRIKLFPGDSWRCQVRHVYGNIQLLGNQRKTGNVVGMFMGDENTVQILRALADAGETLESCLPAQARINKDARPLGSDERGIARTAAGENTKLNDGSIPPGNFPCSTTGLEAAWLGAWPVSRLYSVKASSPVAGSITADMDPWDLGNLQSLP